MDSQKTWHIEDIKAELRKRYGSLSALGHHWGLKSPTAISATLSAPGYSRHVERLIAAELQVDLHILWPDRWSPDGSPLSHRADRSPTRTPADALRAKRTAA
jgi:Ner family transcriptional regulator